MLNVVTLFRRDGSIITSGLQSSRVCSEAINVARRIARDDGISVIVEDAPAEECYMITPRGGRRCPPTGWVPEWKSEQ